MSLIQRVTALAQAVAADIKALYAGKAEKEHTHTAAQVSGLGTAATKNVGTAAGQVVEVGAFGLGYAERAVDFAVRIDSGFYISTGGTVGMPSGMVSDGGWMINLNWAYNNRGNRYNCSFYGNVQNNFIGFRRINNLGVPQAPVELHHTGNTLRIGANKTTALTALNLTQQEKAIKDPSGLWVEQGALTNDMSSYLSSKTYAEMRTKLGVVPVNVVQATGTSSVDVMSQKAVTEAIAAGGGGGSGITVVQEDGLSASAVMSQYAVTIGLADVSMVASIGSTYCLEQHAALHALDPETATLPQLIRALQSATLLDYEEYLPPPEP